MAIRRRAIRLFLLPLLIAVVASACGRGQTLPIPRIAFLFDVSQSDRSSIDGVCMTAVHDALSYAAERYGTLTVETIDANPLADSGTPIDVNASVLSKFAGNPVLQAPMANRLEATATSQLQSIVSNPSTGRGTDMMAAFQLANRILSRPPIGNSPQTKYLIVCSDMMATVPPVDFYHLNVSSSEIVRLIGQLRASGEVPDWRGVQVYVVGADTTSGSGVGPARALGVQAFFEAYFQAAGARLVSYASTLPQFP
jgi:hypothetical protein